MTKRAALVPSLNSMRASPPPLFRSLSTARHTFSCMYCASSERLYRHPLGRNCSMRGILSPRLYRSVF